MKDRTLPIYIFVTVMLVATAAWRIADFSMAVRAAGQSTPTAIDPLKFGAQRVRIVYRSDGSPISANLFHGPSPAVSIFPALPILAKPIQPASTFTFLSPPSDLSDYTYAGSIEVDGRRMALIENSKTREGTYVAEGDVWQGRTIGAITADSVAVEGAGGTQRLAKSDAFSIAPLAADAANYVRNAPTLAEQVEDRAPVVLTDSVLVEPIGDLIADLDIADSGKLVELDNGIVNTVSDNTGRMNINSLNFTLVDNNVARSVASRAFYTGYTVNTDPVQASNESAIGRLGQNVDGKLNDLVVENLSAITNPNVYRLDNESLNLAQSQAALQQEVVRQTVVEQQAFIQQAAMVRALGESQLAQQAVQAQSHLVEQTFYAQELTRANAAQIAAYQMAAGQAAEVQRQAAQQAAKQQALVFQAIENRPAQPQAHFLLGSDPTYY